MGQEKPSAARFGRFSKFFTAAALVIAAGAALTALWRARQDRRFLITGPARWIWYTRQIPEPAPLRFRAWKDFRLDGEPPASAPARLFGDREWVLEINDQRAGSGAQSPGDPLAVFELAPMLRTGANRVLIEAASPNGVGGLLYWMDLGGGRVLVTDATWRVERLPAGAEGPQPAAVWGRPPLYPWGYPRLPGRGELIPRGGLVPAVRRFEPGPCCFPREAARRFSESWRPPPRRRELPSRG